MNIWCDLTFVVSPGQFVIKEKKKVRFSMPFFKVVVFLTLIHLRGNGLDCMQTRVEVKKCIFFFFLLHMFL